MASRKLPVFILLDCSGSMDGPPIESVRQGLESLVDELSANPQAEETVYLCALTFSSGARMVAPLAALNDFTIPQIKASGCTDMGAALELVASCIEKDVSKGDRESKGDWRPLVFLLTDGEPTDDWAEPAKKLKQVSPRPHIIALGAGPSANEFILHQIGDEVMIMADMRPEDFMACFNWVTQSILSVATSGASTN